MFDPSAIHEAIDAAEAAFNAASDEHGASDARRAQFAAALVSLRSTADLASIEDQGPPAV